MAKKFSLVVTGNNDDQPVVSGRIYYSFNSLINYFRGWLGGARLGSVSVACRNDLVAATGTLTVGETATGTVGGTINGVTVTVTWATDDATTATAIAAAINASGNALVNQHVSAAAVDTVVTLTAKNPGASGNAITLAASGTGITASGARLTAGSESTLVTFTK